MKAIVSRSYGSPDVVQIEDVAMPVPKENEVLVRNFASVVSASDCAARDGKNPFARLYFGLTRPRFPILGTSFAGEVHSVGSTVTAYRAGDHVMGSPGPTMSSHAEFVRIAEDGVITGKPEGLTWTDSVAIFDGALTALPFLRDSARLKSGQSILINGASGAVGSAAVQLAKHFGATVTAVTSTPNLELIRSLGADEVIDYTAIDFTRSGKTYDVVFDAVGKSTYSRSRKLLKPGGIYLTTVPSLTILAQMLWTSKIGKTKAAIAFTGLRKAAAMAKDVAYMGELTAAGNYVAVIDKQYTLEQASAAHAHVETGRKRGSVVISLA
jgi:NADPH:quinone reductase-like Zn-dependent oxidoreductase